MYRHDTRGIDSVMTTYSIISAIPVENSTGSLICYINFHFYFISLSCRHSSLPSFLRLFYDKTV
jgi:hypothetical protein